MGEATGISWTNSTFNPWWGCVKVSEACRNCYALAWDRRTGGEHWGPQARRRFFGEKHWNEPRRWERQAAAEGKPWRVFCSSMADVFEALPDEHPDVVAMAEARSKLWDLIAETPHLTWLLLTKRPENIARCFPWAPASDGTPLFPPPPNVWLGTTVESQETASKRLPELLKVPAVVHFASVEPLLEGVTLSPWLGPGRLSWVIVGGESGSASRPFDLDWARRLKAEASDAGAAFWFKQKGHNVVDRGQPLSCIGKGDDPAVWPAELQRQELPIARAA